VVLLDLLELRCGSVTLSHKTRVLSLKALSSRGDLPVFLDLTPGNSSINR
jgi:hypothetical protein